MAQDPAARRASGTLLARKQDFAREITERMYRDRPEWAEKYGAEGRARCLEDMEYNLEHLAPAVALAEPEMFVRYVEWLVELLHARGVPMDDVRLSLQTTRAVLSAALPADEHATVEPVLRSALDRIGDGTRA